VGNQIGLASHSDNLGIPVSSLTLTSVYEFIEKNREKIEKEKKKKKEM
jgi:hypothetical protein